MRGASTALRSASVIFAGLAWAACASPVTPGPKVGPDELMAEVGRMFSDRVDEMSMRPSDCIAAMRREFESMSARDKSSYVAWLERLMPDELLARPESPQLVLLAALRIDAREAVDRQRLQERPRLDVLGDALREQDWLGRFWTYVGAQGGDPRKAALGFFAAEEEAMHEALAGMKDTDIVMAGCAWLDLLGCVVGGVLSQIAGVPEMPPEVWQEAAQLCVRMTNWADEEMGRRHASSHAAACKVGRFDGELVMSKAYQEFLRANAGALCRLLTRGEDKMRAVPAQGGQLWPLLRGVCSDRELSLLRGVMGLYVVVEMKRHTQTLRRDIESTRKGRSDGEDYSRAALTSLYASSARFLGVAFAPL